MTKIEIKKNINLAKFNTWRIGGVADWLAEPKNIDELQELLSWANKKQINSHLIGAGSNLLIHDQGLRGLSICMRKFKGCNIDKSSGLVEVMSGEKLPNLSKKVANEGLHGLEWAVGIPGTIGGAVVMNAGAQDNCIAEHIECVQVVSLKDQKIYELNCKDLQFSYRDSLLQKEPKLVISARLKLEPGYEKFQITKTTNENLNHRLSTQPYQNHTCGSVFRNPEPLKAAKLIEGVGLKGFQMGGAAISKIHANFIININNASAKDIQKLISLVQEKVMCSYGVLLKTEVKAFGF